MEGGAEAGWGHCVLWDMEHASLCRRKRSGWCGFGRTNISGESGRVHTRGR